MTVRSLLTQGYDTLFYAEVQTPFLDAVVLLGHAMEVTKEKLLASLPDQVPPGAEARFRGFLDLRCIGSSGFLHQAGEGVLRPRLLCR